MKNVKSELVIYSRVLLVAVILITILCMFLVVNFLGLKYRDNITFLNSDWNYYLETINKDVLLELPTNIKNISKEEIVKIERELPNNIEDNTYLLIRSELQKINVYINDELIYSLRDDENQWFGKEPESRWNFVKLPKSSSGSNIKITYKSQYKGFNGKINSLLLGEKGSLILYILTQYGTRIIVSVAFISIAVILCSIYIGLLKSKERFVSIFYLAIINFFVSLWIGSDSKVIELFLPSWFPIAEVKLISLYLTALILIIFFRELLNCKNFKALKYLLYAYYVYVPVAIVLHITNVYSLIETITIFHIMLIFELVIMFALVIYYGLIKNRNKDIKFILLAVCILIFAAAGDVLSYYLTNGRETSEFFRMNLLIFSIVFSVLLGKQILSLYDNEVKIEIYKELAYKDGLTGLGNRAAFQNKMNEINNNKCKYINKSFFICDLNNLKSVNDTLGHDYGDKYITEVSKILNKFLGKYGDLYRIGGDEFVFIASKKFNEEEIVKNINKSSEDLKSHFNEINVGIAIGYNKIISDLDDNPYSAYSAADKRMYENKKEMKKNKLLFEV